MAIADWFYTNCTNRKVLLVTVPIFILTQVCIFTAVSYMTTTDGKEVWPPPDSVFPYNPEKLANVINTMSKDGHFWYRICSLFDLFAYIPTYLICFSLILAACARFASISRRVFRGIFLLSPITAILDVGETTLLHYFNQIHPIDRHWRIVSVEQVFSNLKNIGVMIMAAIVAILLVVGVGKRVFVGKSSPKHSKLS